MNKEERLSELVGKYKEFISLCRKFEKDYPLEEGYIYAFEDGVFEPIKDEYYVGKYIIYVDGKEYAKTDGYKQCAHIPSVGYFDLLGDIIFVTNKGERHIIKLDKEYNINGHTLKVVKYK